MDRHKQVTDSLEIPRQSSSFSKRTDTNPLVLRVFERSAQQLLPQYVSPQPGHVYEQSLERSNYPADQVHDRASLAHLAVSIVQTQDRRDCHIIGKIEAIGNEATKRSASVPSSVSRSPIDTCATSLKDRDVLPTKLILLATRLRLARPVTVADIVAVASRDATRVESVLRELYGWHHVRAIAGLQVALAPAVVAGLALASRGASSALLIVAAAFLVTAMVAGLWCLSELHRFDYEFVFALALAKTVADLTSDLWSPKRGLMLDGERAEPSTPASKLYEDAGHLTLAECTSEPSAKAALARALTDAGLL